MSDFLLELRSEEIPARMQAGARTELERLFRREMEAAGVPAGEVTVWSTPRRLALIARDVPEATQAVSEEAKGPPEGAPDAAIDGFCRKNGVTRDQLELRDVKGRNTWFAVIDKPGRATKELLSEAIPAIVRTFSWPKSMRWGAASLGTESLRWVRPLSGIVAILGEDLVECEVEGIRSGYATMGHRFHHSGDITIGGAHDYAEKLRACHVIVDHEERQDIIRQLASEAARTAGFSLVEDEGLVIENAGLTEWPVPLLGRFDREFLDVPPEVIQLTARVNQKYFVCTSSPSKLGEDHLANAFVCTANIDSTDCGAAIVDGNRKVLAARLSDARFFWEQDRKTPLADQAKKLERITFHEKLGTVADKVERVAKLARWLVEEGIVKDSPLPAGEGPGVGGATSRASNTHPQPVDATRQLRSPSREGASLADLAEQAARLCKADLVTEMVGEFPELQGVMGGYYARAEGLPDEVADAIRDHYKPVGQGDDVPTAPVTVAVSLADKLDTILSFAVINEMPTGSRDPFAIRRAALSVLRTLAENGIRLSLLDPLELLAIQLTYHRGRHMLSFASDSLRWLADEWLEAALEGNFIVVTDTETVLRPTAGGGHHHFPKELSSPLIEMHDYHRHIGEVTPVLLDFFADRLKVQQREAGVRHDLIDAVFALGVEDDLVRLLARVHALQAFVTTEDGANLLAGYKRAANILKKSPLPMGEGPGVGGATSQASNTHPQPVDATRQLRFPSREGALEHTADEDPLENVDDPDMRAIYAAAAEDAAIRGAQKTLSYTPEPAEKALIEALDAAEPRAASAIEAEDFAAAMSALASLRAPIDRFFEDVIVNAEEEAKRTARLELLARFRDAVHRVADFSRIEG